MLDESRERLRAVFARLRRIERRELREFRAWIENTRNLLHLTVLVVMPLLLGLVTYLANLLDFLPFLLFPPLASGTYMLFAHPEERYSSPRRFVGGLTTGAFCGWIALEATARYWYGVPPAAFDAHPGAVAFGIFLTGAVTWALDIEEAQAFSTALLVLVVGVTELVYVLSVFLSTVLVAAVFTIWRSRFYERRSRYLYTSTQGDDHVLVPMRGNHRNATAMLGARLAAAHEAGKVVLLDVVDDEVVARTKQALLEGDGEAATDGGREGHPATTGAEGERTDDRNDRDLAELAEERAVAETATALENRADRIKSTVGVPCQVMVAAGERDRSETVLQAAREANCDLIVTPYEERHGALSPFVGDLFRGNVDVLAHRSTAECTQWESVLVPVRRTGDTAHAMLDFAERLAGSTGRIAACHCLGGTGSRRRAEHMLADLVETFSGNIETRVSQASIEDFLANEAPQYDLTIIGASRDRSAASRFVSPPTFQRIQSVDCDVAVLDRSP